MPQRPGLLNTYLPGYLRHSYVSTRAERSTKLAAMLTGINVRQLGGVRGGAALALALLFGCAHLAAGRLERSIVPPPAPFMTAISAVFGFAVVITGVTLIALVIFAG